MEIMYTAEDDITVGPILYADDNLTPLALDNANQIQPVLRLYEQYTGVSGLNINVRKTTVLCINTGIEVQEGLTQAGLAITTAAKHLGIYLAPTIEDTVAATMASINPKGVKRRILATTPPTDILHRATLINVALLPIYNHVFMALPVDRSYTDELQKEIQKFLWTRQLDGQTKQKRRLVAKGRLAAGLEMGGLGIQPPENTVQGFQQNLIQKLYKRINQPQGSLLPDILSKLLQRSNRPTLVDHVERLGPEQWNKTAMRLQNKNMTLAYSFRSVATLLAFVWPTMAAWCQASLSASYKVSKVATERKE